MENQITIADAEREIRTTFPFLPAERVTTTQPVRGGSWTITVSFGVAGSFTLLGPCCPEENGAITSDGRKLFGASSDAVEPLLRSPNLPKHIRGELLRTIRNHEELQQFLGLCRTVLEEANNRLLTELHGPVRVLPVNDELDRRTLDDLVMTEDGLITCVGKVIEFYQKLTNQPNEVTRRRAATTESC